MTHLLDTNVLSEFQRPEPDRNVIAWLTTADETGLFLSVVSLAEIHRGVALMNVGARRRALESWVREDLPRRFGPRVLDVTPAVAEAWGGLAARAQRAGAGLSVMDGLIAATARVHGLTLATRNVKDFAALDVPLLNPWTPQAPT